ncbi:MAG: tetratricopeptide repeat protein [Bacteroidales bacterium]
MKQKKCLLLLLISVTFSQLWASSLERKDIRKGNREYNKSDFHEAELSYRRALDKVPNSAKAIFNLGNALYMQVDSVMAKTEEGKKQVEQARKNYETAVEGLLDNKDKAVALFNQGNAYLREQNFDGAIEAYKRSLRLTPNDIQVKQNLVFAQAMKSQQPPERQQKQQQDKDSKDKDQSNNKQNKNEQPSEDSGQQTPKNQEQKNNSLDQSRDKISKEDAQRMLQALAQQEKDTQEKVKKEKAEKTQQRRVEKNW